MAENISDKTSGQLRAILDKNSGASQKEVLAAITELKKRGEETPPPSLVMGGRKMKKGGMPKKDKVPVITIGVGMAEIPKGKKGPMKMAMGGMANGKKHMYLSEGALVTENLNPGLKALAKKRPDVVKKILKKS
tara:strand:- start:123 stop:524 length:402 start_codon:yes stop_codon:yes gene_type:complete